MELHEAIAQRHMVRSFERRPVDPAVVDSVLHAAWGAPSAGRTRGTAWVTLVGPEETQRYWEHTTTWQWRERSSRWPGLSRAPVLLVSLCSPHHYVERYGEADKAGSGLGPLEHGGGGAAAWPVPYWFGDAAFETMSVLLAVTAAGLGACFLGNFRGEAPLLSSLGVPQGWRLFGTVALGHPDGADHPSASLARPEPAMPRRHDGRWGGAATPRTGGSDGALP